MSHLTACRILPVMILAATACGSGGIVGLDNQSRHISLNVGQELTVTLGNIGPGTYASPPQMSSDVLTYLGVEIIPPFTPGGPTQQFRFIGARRGQSIVEFRRALGDSTLAVVKDTVDVR